MHEINRVGVCFILKHTANLPHLNFIRIFSRIDRGQYGNRSSHNKKLKHQVNGTYDWKCMVLLRKDTNNPSLNAIGESLARAFNNHNKKIDEKDQFEFGEAVSVDAKTLSYHIEEINTTKILRNMLRKLDREAILKKSSCMKGFYPTVERGVEIVGEMTDEEFEDLLEP